MAKSYHWDLSKIFASDEDVKKTIIAVKEGLKELDKLKKAPEKHIYEIMELRTKICRNMDRLASYAEMKRDENSKVAKSQKLASEMEILTNEVGASFSFLPPCLLQLTPEQWTELKKDQRYEFYSLFFERVLREKQHRLSKEQEYIISSYRDVARASHNAFYMLSYADMKFPKLEQTDEELNHSSFVKMLFSKNRALRKEAFEKFYATYRGVENTIAATLAGNVKGVITEAKLRNFQSAREMALFDDNVDLKVYDALLASVHKAFPAIYDYFALKKQLLGVDEYHMYDVYTNVSDYDRKVTFEEAQQIVKEALKPMGEEYLSIVQKAFDENWIDVYPGEGKRNGAYSGGCYDSAPYILMNFNDNLESVFTLIHEMGHSVHSYLSRANNQYLYSEYTIFVAEVASTTNEMLLIHYLMEHSKSEEEKVYLLNYYTEMFKSTVIRQTMFAEFEKIIHEKAEAGEALTAQDFKKIYHDLVKLYFGESVVADDEIALEWARIPHFYTDFYVYKYATGFSAAAVLSKRILSGKKEALDAYFNFLKDGNKHFPLDQLKKAGADMANPQIVDSGLEQFGEAVKQLKELVCKK